MWFLYIYLFIDAVQDLHFLTEIIKKYLSDLVSDLSLFFLLPHW